MRLEKGLLLFVRGDLAALTKFFWLQSGFRQSGSLGFSPLPEAGYEEEYKRVFFSSSVPLARLLFGDDRYVRRG